MKFSIIVVCLNSKEKLRQTLNSITDQNFTDYEVIVKDGGSTDNSLECLKEMGDFPIKLYSESDKGIYDAMNEAVKKTQGEYIYFLNCGDVFVSNEVLSSLADGIEKICAENNSEKGKNKWVFYGNILQRTTGQVIASNPVINGFACYRNIPCHQACFYDRRLLTEHPFEIKYKVRADYEHFLWCYYRGNASFKYIDLLISDYEGSGYSEQKANLKVSKQEHKEITEKYMSAKDLFKYRAILFVTLAPIRTGIANNPQTAALYNRIKSTVYRKK